MKYSWPFRADVVKVPWRSELYNIILNDVQRCPRPKEYYRNTGNTTFRLPNQAYGKQSSVYNWLSHSSIKEIEEWIEVMMWSDFHRYVEYQLHVQHKPLNESVRFFISMYGIISISEDAFIKNWQRWLDKASPYRRRHNVKKAKKTSSTLKTC